MVVLRRVPIALLLVSAAASAAGIEALTLNKMLRSAEEAIFGTIKSKEVWKGPLASVGTEVEFTTIEIEGEDLLTGRPITRRLTYIGSEQMPVSEMPTAHETAKNKRVIVFGKARPRAWGGRTGIHELVAGPGGLFAVEAGPKGDVVLGKGVGFAIENTEFLKELRARIATEIAQIRRERRR